MKSPWYPRYPQDFIGSMDCRLMTLEQFGLYNWLLDYSWNNESFPCYLEHNPEWLSRLIGVPLKKYLTVWMGVQKKFNLYIDAESGKEYIFNPRLLGEFRRQIVQRERQAEKGVKSGIARREKREPGAIHAVEPRMNRGSFPVRTNDEPEHEPNGQPKTNPLQSQSQLQTPIVPLQGTDGISYSPDFLEFWRDYPRKESKADAFKAWKKLRPSQSLQQIIREAVAKQKLGVGWRRDNGQFIPHPASWLNAAGWENETPGTPLRTVHSGVQL